MISTGRLHANFNIYLFLTGADLGFFEGGATNHLGGDVCSSMHAGTRGMPPEKYLEIDAKILPI